MASELEFEKHCRIIGNVTDQNTIIDQAVLVTVFVSSISPLDVHKTYYTASSADRANGLSLIRPELEDDLQKTEYRVAALKRALAAIDAELSK